MLDFKRIGGEVVSSPLNENFRKLRNDISISNTNLVFSETDPVKDTIQDMLDIKNPVNAQVCYVVSSGELYRYAIHDKEWHKIADFGQTFRQGFLNSGAVVLENYITLKEGSKTVLNMPAMLVYFKSQPGDERYLKGMYLVEAKEFDIKDSLAGANAYSIVVDVTGDYTLISGMPMRDDPEHIFIGTVLVNDKKEVIPHFVYTLPDMAYTADRGQFLLNGGQAEGMNLVAGATDGLTVDRNGGYYYDEGINFILGETKNYPVNTDNGANYNLKYYQPQSSATLIYMAPVESLSNMLEPTNNLVINKYWDGSAIVDVQPGYFTIQKHLVTPNGQNIILLGDKEYNSITDAVSNINASYELGIDFPHVEASRIVVGNVEGFTSDNTSVCRFYTLGHLTQVGNITPEFADNVFKIYSGDTKDITPSSVRFDLSKLQTENYNNLYNLVVAPYNTIRDKFSLPQSFDDGVTPKDEVTQEHGALREYNGPGYLLADNEDLKDAKARISRIEKEIWALLDESQTAKHKQSIRYRLYDAEKRLDAHDKTLNDYDVRLDWLEANKVYKKTTINGYALGSKDTKDEITNIILYTDDIAEKDADAINQWFTQDRVKKNEWVIAAKSHYDTKSANGAAAEHIKVNPHNLSTDDINYLTNTQKVFVTPEEAARIHSSKLPDNTIQALADLDAKNMDDIQVDVLNGNSEASTGEVTQLGKVTGLRFYNDGVNLEVTEDGKTLIVECKGQVDEDLVMMRNRYATQEMKDPTNPELQYTVDKAVTAIAASAIHGIASAGADKYYGTDKEGIPGIYDIEKFVTTADVGSFTDIDQVTFVPIDGSVQEKHLESGLANKINNNYHKVYNTGVLSSQEINTFNFGDNLTVTVEGNTATINAEAANSSATKNFANLADVEVTYTGNKGRMLVVNENENGISVANALSMDEYMLESVYVDTTDVTKVKKAVKADNATTADTATNALKLSNKTVDDTKTNDTALWTASKIISYISSQIQSEGVNTHSGTSAPSNSIGKDGDIYVLIES